MGCGGSGWKYVVPQVSGMIGNEQEPCPGCPDCQPCVFRGGLKGNWCAKHGREPECPCDEYEPKGVK